MRTGRSKLKPQRDGGPGLKLRGSQVELECATRHDESKVDLLSTGIPEVADATMRAKLYRQR